MSFERIKYDARTRTEVYSDGILEITLRHPVHHDSGIPCDVTVTESEQCHVIATAPTDPPVT